MLKAPKSSVLSRISQWALVEIDEVDVSFLARQHRRRLSLTTQLALTAYHRCNPQAESVPTVFASRYGEYARTFGILSDIAAGEPTSPAAFSVSVHNTPSGIVGIATSNQAPSSTVAANSTTVEAGFLEAALQHAGQSSEDLIFIFVDEPLPDLYRTYQGPTDCAFAVGLRLTSSGSRSLELSWAPQADDSEAPIKGIPQSGRAVVQRLNSGRGCWQFSDGRLCWDWTIE